MLERDRLSQDVPAWYRLDANSGQLYLSVHKQALPQIGQEIERTAQRCQERLKLKRPFTPPSSDREWGFGPVLSEREDRENPDWLIYSCSLPAHTKPDGIDWDSLYETSATLEVLLENLWTFERETNSSSPQMLTVTLSTSKASYYGGSLEAMVRPALAKWLNQNIGKDREPVIARAMREAYFKMRHVDKESRDSLTTRFMVWIRDPKWINLDCPGNACGLDPKDYYNTDIACGYEMHPHNTDTPLQQLTLLSGLAKLDKLAHDDYLPKL